jgi:hypothetical protein
MYLLEFTSVLYIHAYISSTKQRMDGWMDGKILPTCKSRRDLGPWGKI